ncbi:MAG: substrate-binding domain-containing protein [Armatimonadetes bacterium]|nr:substrate-binding domain-containing protein [Armatimonadota bacterium]
MNARQPVLARILLVAAPLLILAGCARQQPAQAPAAPSTPATSVGQQTAQITVAMIPKIEGIDYFNACQRGAEEAARELGVKLLYRGPTENKVERQIEIIDSFIAQGVDVIAVSPNDPVAIAPALKKAREKNIHVIAWDADAQKDAREFFVNQATAESVGYALVDEMVAQIGDKAEVAIVTGSLTAANQNEWIKYMKKRAAEKYPGLHIVAVKPSEEDQQLAFQVTQDLLKAYPNIKGVFAITSVAFPGAADAVEQAGKKGKVAVVGLATPKGMKPWVKSGTVKTVILWNPVDLGYLTIYVAKALASGELKTGASEVKAGRLGSVKVVGDEVILGEPMKFNAQNIDQYDF